MMKGYLIGYDLNKSGQNYATLIEEIKKLGNWWHCLDSTFIIISSSTAVAIRDHLQQYVDSNDKLLVVLLSREAAWAGLSEECSDWLTNNL